MTYAAMGKTLSAYRDLHGTRQSRLHNSHGNHSASQHPALTNRSRVAIPALRVKGPAVPVRELWWVGRTSGCGGLGEPGSGWWVASRSLLFQLGVLLKAVFQVLSVMVACSTWSTNSERRWRAVWSAGSVW